MQDDLKNARERLAQATLALDFNINMGPNSQGVPLPAALQDGTCTVSPLNQQGLHDNFSDDELALIALRDTDENSIDLFYVEDLSGADRAHSYTATGAALASNQAGVAGTNWIVAGDNVRIFSIAHEFMHILLDSGHRSDPTTSLFFAPTSNTNTINATKRIGPNVDTATPGAAGHGDTTTIRDNAETLP